MMCFRRGIPFVGLMLVAAIVIVAALTTWWVLLALVPLAMMLGCMAMMAPMARRVAGDPRAERWRCC
jgi:hypothetical protein